METIIENENIIIANEVITSIVAITVDENKSFELASKNFRDKVLSKSDSVIKITNIDSTKSISIDVNVNIGSGLIIEKEVLKLQSEIKETLENMTSLSVSDVNIKIESLFTIKDSSTNSK